MARGEPIERRGAAALFAAGAALLAVAAALLAPARAAAATVSVAEQGGEPRVAKLTFAAGAGEANDLTVAIAAEEGAYYELGLVDRKAVIAAGEGCSGGGAPGVAVRCRAHKPTPGEDLVCFKGCTYTPGTRWQLQLGFRLGDGGSRFDSTALPEGPRDPEQPYGEAVPIQVTVTPGAGNDTVLTGAGSDLVESSPGADLVRTGKGMDVFTGGAGPDGADDVDLGEGAYDSVDYSERSGDVRYDPNGVADDGEPGEGDNLGAAVNVEAGAGDDDLLAPSFASGGGITMRGGAGDDTIAGSEGGDELFGGPGDDLLAGGDGADWLVEYGAGGDYIDLYGGDDLAFGGADGDQIELGDGEDRADGGAGKDLLRLGPGADRGRGGAGGDLVLGQPGPDRVEGGPGADRLSGDGGRDLVLAGPGNDEVAAGFVPTRPRQLPRFTDSLGPLERKPDRVRCGAGTDAVKFGPADAVAGCEHRASAAALETQEVSQGENGFPARLSVLLRRPGRVELTGPGVAPQSFASPYDYWNWGPAIRPQGKALARLLAHGRVQLRLRLAFRPRGEPELVRTRTVELSFPVGLRGHGPA